MANLHDEGEGDEISSSDSDGLFQQVAPTQKSQKSKPVISPFNIDQTHERPNYTSSHQYDQIQSPSNTRKTNKWLYVMISICILLLLYCTIGVTYLFIDRMYTKTNDTKCTCSNVVEMISVENSTSISSITPSNTPSVSPISSEPTPFPTTYSSDLFPSNSPTTVPTKLPSSIPSETPTEQPSLKPTNSPTNKPPLQPTIDHSVYQNYIGDYKISAQTSNHGNWLLCDGTFVDPNIYSELYNIIGYSFGSKVIGTVNMFALPNGEDRILGIDGRSYSMGSNVGNEEITLNSANLPSHFHFIAASDLCDGNYQAIGREYLSQTCWGLYNDDRHYYRFGGVNDTIPNRWKSSSVGEASAISVIQPTIFIGDLFIYAGDA